MTEKELRPYCKINGKYVALEKLPCFKCDERYGIHCPKCEWNSDGRYNTYNTVMLTEKEAKENGME